MAAELIGKQNHLFGLISRFRENFSKMGQDKMTLGAAKTRLSTIDAYWSKFVANHDQLLEYAADKAVKEDQYFKTDLFSTCEEKFFDAKSFLIDFSVSLEAQSARGRRGSLESTSSDSDRTPSHSRAFPKISLPHFAGKYSQWPPFRDLFTSMVVNNDMLTSVEKLHYIKTSVSGDAAKLIAGISVTGDNFDRAWKRLTARYENKRVLINTQLETLFSLKPVSRKCPTELEALRSTVTEVLESLESLGQPVDQWDCVLVFFVCRRLDEETREAWELLLGSKTDPPTYQELDAFLEGRIRGLENASARISTTKSRFSTAGPSTPSTARVMTSTSNQAACPLCPATHYIAACPEFKSRTVDQRRELAKTHRLCFNCLGSHRRSDCRSKKRCQSCGENHHTALHRMASGASASGSATANRDSTRQATPVAVGAAQTSSAITHHSIHMVPENRPSVVILATAWITITSPVGRQLQARALLDQGSEISFVTESLASLLRLPRHHSSVTCLGLGAQKQLTTKGALHLRFQSCHDETVHYDIEAHIVPRVSGKIPSSPFTLGDCRLLDGLELADPSFNIPASVDVLLGADIYGQLLQGNVIKGSPSAPVAQLTTLGWIISGPTSWKQASATVHGLHCQPGEDDLNQLVQDFWAQETVPAPRGARLTAEEEACERHFAETHRRGEDGRYVVSLPFRVRPADLGDSRPIAARMLRSAHRRFTQDPSLKNLYVEFMNQYEELGHMQRVENVPTDAFFLPHHGVLRESSTSTKLRVVFNASQKTAAGHSVNEYLHQGPKKQQELVDVIMRWRLWPYVFGADVEKMFRQISLQKEDRKYQCILWSKDPSQEPSVFELTTVTYGFTSSPYLATRVLHQLAEDEKKNFPMAAKVVLGDTYVDDVLSGDWTVEAAQEKVDQVNQLFLAGGFTLQKWISNVTVVLSSISAERRLNVEKIFEDQSVLKALGLRWRPYSDEFIFTFHEEILDSAAPTKRSVLSLIAKLFDPLGWLAPVIVLAKLFLQTLWTVKLDWDEALPDHLVARWNDFIRELRQATSFGIPRWVGVLQSSIVELHGFSDASRAALGAVVYLRVLDAPSIRANLIVAKSRVAPLKPVTIARLELSAAVLLVQLVQRTCSTLNLAGAPVHLWTDSAVALAWIRAGPARWKEFVANRVALIQERAPSAEWHHVAGVENPADMASRGLNPSQLQTCEMWWNGPAWLSQPVSAWPNTFPAPGKDANLEEKPLVTHTVTAVKMWELMERYSSIEKLVRITALVKEAVSRMRRNEKAEWTYPVPSPTMLDEALVFWIRSTQSAYFASELAILKRGQTLPRSNCLVRLTPVVLADGLLRLGGRLRHSSLDAECKQPVILPRRSAISTLLIEQAHRRTYHGGTQLTLATLRQKYWIVGGRAPVRSVIQKCVMCVRQRGATLGQQMGQLPALRTTPSRPFLHSGVDYAGPFVLKTWRGRAAKTQKHYLVVFVCFSTSAVHLELSGDYTTAGFIAAYKRFSGRRGLCSTLTSDCGTNFVGADAELKRMFDAASREVAELRTLLAKDRTTWNFNPPSAPHFGGKWEAAVKSVKFHIRRVIGEALLTHEEFTTLLVQIESALNSRPLTPLSEDPDDCTALTPGHFLIGEPLNSVPEPALADTPSSRLSRWERTRQMLEHFWNRWSREYLQKLQTVSKWQHPRRQLAVGALVLVADERYPPGKWPLARVAQVHPGADGLIRVASVRTACGNVLKRPVVKLCLLPVDTVSDEVN